MPEGPPPATPPRSGTFGPVSTTSLPASPIMPPPVPPYSGSAYDSGMSGLRMGGSEEPSRLVHDLPSLEVGDNTSEASVITGDWLARIAPIMRSLLPSAPIWWSQVTAMSSGFYDRWLHADPLQK